MKHQGLNNRGEDIVTLYDMREYVEGEVEEIMNIIEGLGGGQFLPITGGELTGDLWLHTGKGNYGSRLIFGDKGSGVAPLTYIGEDADDILTIKGDKGIKLKTDAGDIILSSLNDITLSGDYNIGISAYNNLTLRGTASAELKTSGVLTLFGDSGIEIKAETSKEDVIPDITMAGNIMPLFNNRYTIGATNVYYKHIYANSFYCGAHDNNLNLHGGVNSTYGIRFRLSNYASSPAITELGNWTSTALTVNTQLKIGSITLKDGGNGKLLVNGVAIN